MDISRPSSKYNSTNLKNSVCEDLNSDCRESLFLPVSPPSCLLFQDISEIQLHQPTELCALEDPNSDCVQSLPQCHCWMAISRPSSEYSSADSKNSVSQKTWTRTMQFLSSIIAKHSAISRNILSITPLTHRALGPGRLEQWLCTVSSNVFPKNYHFKNIFQL